MTDVLKILILEDYPDDAELMKRQISKAGIMYRYMVVDTRKGFMNALTEFKPDLILSDYSLPSFNGMDALNMRKDMAPLVPFILVTSSLNEDIAVEVMKAGADDYVIKQNLTRLVSAIDAAIRKQKTIREKLQAEEDLRESERTFRKLYTNMNEGVCLYKLTFNREGVAVNYQLVSVNHQFEKIVNIPEAGMVGRLATDIPNNPLPFNVKEYRRVANDEKTLLFESFYQPLGKHLLISVSPWIAGGFAVIVTDVTAIKKAEDILKGKT